MSNSTLHKACRGGIEAAIEAIKLEQTLVVQRAIRSAEIKNDFLAYGTLREAQKKMGLTAVVKTKKAPKAGKEIKISRDVKKVSDTLFELVTERGCKLGTLVAQSQHTRTFVLRDTKGAPKYVKALKDVDGITVEETKSK